MITLANKTPKILIYFLSAVVFSAVLLYVDEGNYQFNHFFTTDSLISLGMYVILFTAGQMIFNQLMLSHIPSVSETQLKWIAIPFGIFGTSILAMIAFTTVLLIF